MNHSRYAAALVISAAPMIGASGDSASGLQKQFDAVDPHLSVVCLLPGKVRKLGGIMTYLERRKPAEMSSSECEIRGGEYTLYDRAHYATALEVWRESALAGDATAQIYVGEIYEKGWTGQPDYPEAARWYALAAAQGDRRAERRLAYFYENGLGVERDSQQALSLWRSALGLQEDLVLASELEAAKTDAQQQIDALVVQIEQQDLQTGRLKSALDDHEQALEMRQRELEEAERAMSELERALAAAAASDADARRVRELEAELAARDAATTQQQLTIELLEADIVAQRAQVEASARQAELRQRQLVTTRQQLEQEAARGDRQLRELAAARQALSDMNAQLADARRSTETAREREQALAQELAGRRPGQSDSTDRDAELRDQLARMQRQTADQQRHLQELERTLADERGRFEQRLAQANLREDQLDAALARSQADKAQLAETLQAAQNRIDELESAAMKVREELADARADSEALARRLQSQATEDAERDRLLAAMRNQRDTIARLEAERARYDEEWQQLSAERDDIRDQLAAEVGRRSWLEVELVAEKGKLATAHGDLQKLQRALEEAGFEKQSLASKLTLLSEDLEVAQSRGSAERAQLSSELERTQMLLTQADAEVSTLRQQKVRLETEIEMIGSRRTQMLAMRSAVPAQPAMEFPKGLRAGPYRALIIANYDYQFLPDLTTPANDANELKLLLEQRYGFQVDVEINLNRSEMFAALNRVRQYAEDDFVLVYYAGHGRMDEYGDGYWLPTDYQLNQPLAAAISSTDITQKLKQSPARHVLLVADSCYSGALLRNSNPLMRASAPALMKFWLANRSRTALTSGGLKPVLDQGPNNHSVFAAALLQVLQNNPGALNGEILHSQVHDLVQEEAAQLGYLDQQPQFSAIEDAGHENGQFVFVRTGA